MHDDTKDLMFRLWIQSKKEFQKVACSAKTTLFVQASEKHNILSSLLNGQSHQMDGRS